jgi:hypothetical protein
MKKIFTSFILTSFFLTYFISFFNIENTYSDSSTLQKLNNENKKIQSEIEKIYEEKFSLKTQTDFLEKKLDQLFIEKKIFLEKKQQFQKKLEEKI